MKKDDIIAMLGKQLKDANAVISEVRSALEASDEKVGSLTALVNELTARVKELEQMLAEKGVALEKQEKTSRTLGRMLDGKKSEKQQHEEEKPAMTLEEYRKMLEERRGRRKARGNNGAKRDMHIDMETVYVDVDPEVGDRDLQAMRLIGTREVVRYSMVPAKVLKTVYRIRSYTDGDTVYQGSAPKAALRNSSYDSSFIAHLMELRYVYSMPVERIVDYIGANGFTLNKPTAHKLLKRGSDVLKNIYDAIGQAIKQQEYNCLDESYHKILQQKPSPDASGVRKGYIFGSLAPLAGLIYFWCEGGSRSEDVLIKAYKKFRGVLQSDAFTGYKKLEADDYPDITRVACLQHIKRKFLDCGEDDKAAMKVVGIINRLYRKEHRHKTGEKGWTVEKNREYRQKYAPPILLELKNELESMRPIKEHLPKSNLGKAVGYALNEFSAVCDIFRYGFTALDNNAIERCNRYISLSRRNSMFFGSNEGANVGCILYSIAISCRLSKVRLFDYIRDVIDKTCDWPEDTPSEKYRELLPDRWKPND